MQRKKKRKEKKKIKRKNKDKSSLPVDWLSYFIPCILLSVQFLYHQHRYNFYNCRVYSEIGKRFQQIHTTLLTAKIY